jgi:hypothetical protein
MYMSALRDTGAQVNAIPLSVFYLFGDQKDIRQTGMILSGYSGVRLNVKGRCTFKCKYNGTCKSMEFYIIQDPKCRTPVLSYRACLDLKLISVLFSIDGRESVSGLDQYADVFQGLGKFPGTYSIETDPSVPPVVNPPRRVPLALKDRLMLELDRMEKLNVVKRNGLIPW